MSEQFCNRVAKAAVRLKCLPSYEHSRIYRIRYRSFLLKERAGVDSRAARAPGADVKIKEPSC
jgi:hypothetical protein